MSTLLNNYLAGIELGEAQPFKNVVIFPIFSALNYPPEYLTLTEALAQKLAQITEVSAEGQVPLVKVSNESQLCLLLVDGEELVGARQNRTLNTSMLLAGKSETVVPVSCTERGRWSDKGGAFAHAGFVSPHKLRTIKSSSVAGALRCKLGHKSDQQAVWREVDHLCACFSVKSPTAALRDAMAAKARELEEYLKELKPLPDQKGLVVLVNGEVAGADAVSSTRAYGVLHPTFVRSYTMEALLEEKPVGVEVCREKVRAFFEGSKGSIETGSTPIGCGEDHRFQGRGVAGAALVTDNKVIHLNLYRN